MSQKPEQTWTTSYLAALGSPTQNLEFMPQPRSFRAQTVRQAIRLGRGGSRVRLALSNEFGTQPLVIDEIALTNARTGDTAMALHTGNPRWEIPDGKTATSDPADLSVGPGDELIVDCFVAGCTPLGSYLHSAQRTAEAAPGNRLGQPQFEGAEQFASLHWISRVFVDEPADGPVIIAIGDSITRGDCTSIDKDQRYPDHLQRRLLAAGLGNAVVLNAGHGGNRLLRPVAGPSMTDRYARDVLAITEATHVIILAGTNDIGLPPILGESRPTPTMIVNGLLALARRADERGIRPVLATIPPILASRYEFFLAAGAEDTRRGVNDALTSQHDWPVTDFAAALAAPDDPTRLNPAYDSGDGVHPSDAGAEAMAEAIDLAIFQSRTS
jgi:lysophospholipase L1-like esterase